MLGSIVSGVLGAGSSLFNANKDRAMQTKFAKNGIQWRAEDAKKAGLHPLATMGANIPQYSPVGDGGAGQIISQAGQAVDQSIAQAKTTNIQKQATASSIAVDQANIELVQAQKLQIMENIRMGRLKAVGGQQALPLPGKKDKTTPSSIPVKLEDGTIIQYPNPDLGMDLGELATYLGATYYGEARTKLNSFLNPKKKPLEVTIPGNYAKGK